MVRPVPRGESERADSPPTRYRPSAPPPCVDAQQIPNKLPEHRSPGSPAPFPWNARTSIPPSPTLPAASKSASSKPWKAPPAPSSITSSTSGMSRSRSASRRRRRARNRSSRPPSRFGTVASAMRRASARCSSPSAIVSRGSSVGTDPAPIPRSAVDSPARRRRQRPETCCRLRSMSPQRPAAGSSPPQARAAAARSPSPAAQ